MELALTAIREEALIGTINVLDKSLKNISKSKFNNINVSLADFDEMLTDKNNNEILAEHLGNLRNKYGLNFSFGHAPFVLPFYYSDFIAPEAHAVAKSPFKPGERIEGMATNPLMDILNEKTSNCIEICSKLGIKKLNFHLGSFMNKDGSHNVEKSIEENIKFLNRHMKHAANSGITITIENGTNLQNPVLPIPKELIKICDYFNNKYGSKVMGICYDVGHARCGNYNLVQDILDMGANLTETHLTDNYGKDTHNTFGNGDINWSTVAKALNKIGYKNNLTYELNFADTEYEKKPVQALNKEYVKLVNFEKIVKNETKINQKECYESK